MNCGVCLRTCWLGLAFRDLSDNEWNLRQKEDSDTVMMTAESNDISLIDSSDEEYPYSDSIGCQWHKIHWVCKTGREVFVRNEEELQ